MSSDVERPERPLLPPALWSLVTVIALSRLLLVVSPSPRAIVGSSMAVALLAVATALVLGRARLPGARTLIVVVGVSAAASGLACAGELSRQEELAGALSSSPVSSWELCVEGDMREGTSGWRGRARTRAGGVLGASVWVLTDAPIDPGSTIRCVGRFEANDDGAWGASSRAQGIAGTVRVSRLLSCSPAGGAYGAVLAVRSRVLGSLDAPSSDARALVAGAICGYTGAMSERGIDELFASCGVSHLVAVSGGHLVLLSSLLSLLLRGLPLRPLPRSLALMSVTGLFVLFCGLPVSAVRAWAMSLAAELSRHAGRRPHPLSSASLVALVMALVEPAVTGQLGYLLSVMCVCGICSLGAYARYVLRVLLALPEPLARRMRRGRRLLRALSGAEEALAMTLVSQLVTLPLTCATFGTLSVVAPLANVLLGPLFSVLLVLGLLSALFVWLAPVQAALLLGCDAVGGALMVVLRALADLPGAYVAVSVEEGPALLALATSVAALLATWPRVRRRALVTVVGALAVLALAWHVRWRYFAPACVRVLDVGQGDAILVTDGPFSALVDTGPGEAVVGALARSNVSHLDAVVLTHLHSDHAGGLEDLLAVIDVDLLVVPEATDAAELPEGVSVDEVGHGDVLRVGDFTMRVVSPLEPAGGEGNEGSLELALTYERDGRALTALLAADAEREETGAAVERGDVGDVDLLKVGHHGSETSVTPEIAAALAPEVSVASAGEGNGYGHPDPVCVGMLEDAGSLFLCTMDVGDVCVEPGVTGPRVSCQRWDHVRGMLE